MRDFREELKQTYRIVGVILHQCQECRDDDYLLYMKVLKVYGGRMGIDFENMPVGEFFGNFRRLNIPTMETVGRCRRKYQERLPEYFHASKEKLEERKAKAKANRDFWKEKKNP